MAKKPGTALVKWDDELAKMANIAAAAEEATGGGGAYLSLKGGRMAFRGAEIPGNALECVVVDFIFENAYYAGRYDPENPSPPACFAFATPEQGEAGLKPHEKAGSPQCEQCRGCPMNEFGSADTGKGKACKNIRRLALIPADVLENPEEIKNAEIAFMRVPVSSGAAWSGYVRQLAQAVKRPPLGVITRVKLVPDDKTQFRVQFELVEKVPNTALSELMSMREKVRNDLLVPYQQVEEDSDNRGRGSSKKGAAPKGKPTVTKTRARGKF